MSVPTQNANRKANIAVAFATPAQRSRADRTVAYVQPSVGSS